MAVKNTNAPKAARKGKAPAGVLPNTEEQLKVLAVADATSRSVEETIQLLDGTKAIDEALVSIERRGKTLQQDIHVVACSILRHIGMHSDIRMAEKLLSHMPDMARKNSMRDWLTAHGPVMFDGDRPVFVTGGTVKLSQGIANPFWKFSPEKPYEPLVISKAIEQLVKKLQRDEKETKVSHAGLIMNLQKLVPEGATAH